MSLLKSSFIVSVGTAFSRVLGFLRDVVLANQLGASAASDAFFIALTLPNLLRRLFAEGAFNVAFVPLYSSLRQKNETDAAQFSNAIATWLAILLLGVVCIAELIMPAIITLLAPGFVDETEKFEQTVMLGRITFPYLMLISWASFYAAMGNTLGKFLFGALMPSLLNVGIVGGIFIFNFMALGFSPAKAAAIGVIAGGVLQVMMMAYAMKFRFNLNVRFVWPPKHKEMSNFWRRIGPAALSVGILQLSFVIDTQLASLLGGEAISYLNYANRFYQLPLALIGTALATVLLTHFAKDLQQGHLDAANATFQQAIRVGLTLAMAATAGLVVLAEPLLATLLQHGKFSEAATQATAWAMIGYCVGLPGYILTKITSTAFFSSGDTKTPFYTGIFTLCVNVAANLILMQFLGHVGIALATALSGWTQATVQATLLHKRGQFNLIVPGLWESLAKAAGITLLLIGFLILWRMFVPYGGGFFSQFLWLFGVIGFAVAGFGVGAAVSGLLPPEIIAFAKRKVGLKQ